MKRGLITLSQILLLPVILLTAEGIDWVQQVKNKPTNFQADWLTTIINKPSLATVATSGAYSDLTGKPSLWNDPGSGTLLKRTGAFTFAAAAGADINTVLGFTPESTSNKGAASGYAPLNSSSIVPSANLPAAWNDP